MQHAKEKDPKKWRAYFENLIRQCNDISPEDAVKIAEREKCRSIAFTYNEPTIFTEYALDVMEIANKKKIKAYIEKIQPIYTDDKLSVVLDCFKKNNKIALPIIGKDNIPMGVLNEEYLKNLIATPFGHALLSHEFLNGSNIKKYIQECAIVDIHTSMAEIVESYSNFKEAKGVIITKNMEYYGFLSASDIISIINEDNLVSARDQNPLTKMPGNRQIDQYMSEALSNNEDVLFTYFDLNHFKAYNDNYGFRNGDRAIQLFSDTLQKELPIECFKGHIGGDDFFIGMKLKYIEFSDALNHIRSVLERFSQEVRKLYNPDDLERGYILSRDREGIERFFQLLSACAVVVVLKEKSKNRAVDLVNNHFAYQKKVAKQSQGYINVSTLL